MNQSRKKPKDYWTDKRWRYVLLGIIAIALMYGVHLVMGACTTLKHYLGYVYIPDNALLVKDNNGYSVVETDLVNVGIPWPEEDRIKQIDTNHYVFSDIPSWGLALKGTNRVLVSMEGATCNMVRLIGQHTDDIMTHDYLYHLILTCFYKANSSSNIAKWNLPKRMANTFRCLDYNLIERITYALACPVDNMELIPMGQKNELLNYIYRTTSGRNYLLSSIKSEEIGWGLYYYPTLLLDELSYDDDTIIAEDSSGNTLFYRNSQQIVFEFFCKLNNGYYCRVLSTSPIIEGAELIRNIQVDYINDTKGLNMLLGGDVTEFILL